MVVIDVGGVIVIQPGDLCDCRLRKAQAFWTIVGHMLISALGLRGIWAHAQLGFSARFRQLYESPARGGRINRQALIRVCKAHHSPCALNVQRLRDWPAHLCQKRRVRCGPGRREVERGVIALG